MNAGRVKVVAMSANARMSTSSPVIIILWKPIHLAMSTLSRTAASLGIPPMLKSSFGRITSMISKNTTTVAKVSKMVRLAILSHLSPSNTRTVRFRTIPLVCAASSTR